MRQTQIRKSIIEVLVKADSPISALNALSLVRKKNPKVNKTTIYRDLSLLVKENVVEEVDFGEGMKRYHIYKNLKH